MAFVPKDPNLEDEQGQGQEQPGVPPPAGESSALGTGAAPGGTSGGKATPQNRTASSSGFTNLSKYVKANQPQAEALGGQIRSKVGETINQASSQAQDLDKGYAEKVNPNQYKFDAKTFDPLKQDKAQFQNLFAAPKSTFGGAGEVDSATKAIETAKTKVGQVDTIGGRKELISDQQSLSKAAGANTAGLRSFDNLLLQSSKQGQDAIAQAKGDFEAAGLDAKLKAAQERAMAVDAQAAENQKAASTAARDALTKTSGSLNQSLDQRAAAARAQAVADNQNFMQKVKTFQALSTPELARLGVSKEDWARAQKLASQNPNAKPFAEGAFESSKSGGWDISPYLSSTGDLNQLGRENVVTADDIAKSKALAELGGFAGLNLGGVPNQFKAFNTDVNDLDIGKLLADLTPAEVEAAVPQGGGEKPAFLGTNAKSPAEPIQEKVARGISSGAKKGAKEVKSWFS